MSSIAYAADEKMLEYHRLCGTQNINFWRLSSHEGFKDFHPGDLLFFYAHGLRGRKKGLVGYAHYEHTHTMSLKQMWDRYGTSNGYDTMDQMKEAIEKASRNHQVPAKMNCLYLTNVIFFRTPVYPKDAGLSINEKLESYTYIDQDDPYMSVRILKMAERNGIDIWQESQTEERSQDIFRRDAIRLQLGNFCQEAGSRGFSENERRRAEKLVRDKLKEPGWNSIPLCKTECYCLKHDTLTIGLPFVYQARNRQQRLLELLGRITWYQLRMHKEKVRVEHLDFCILQEEEDEEVKKLLKALEENERL
ncbi:MAG: hypothetical protein VZT48_10080 [Bulleidia sp.]|nr:hypothetical protein [Bulleidia sp.]